MTGPNPEIMRRWVTALRSGEYTQGQSALRRVTGSDPISFCCLGVLTDLAIKEGVPGSADWGKPYANGVCPLGGTEFGTLPGWVQTWAGVDDSPLFVLPMGDGNHHCENEDCPGCVSELSAADLNDSGEWSFNDIATLIEEQLMPPHADKEATA